MGEAAGAAGGVGPDGGAVLCRRGHLRRGVLLSTEEAARPFRGQRVCWGAAKRAGTPATAGAAARSEQRERVAAPSLFRQLRVTSGPAVAQAVTVRLPNGAELSFAGSGPGPPGARAVALRGVRTFARGRPIMLSVPPTIKIYVYMREMDMRKGFNALGGVVRSELQSDPTDGHLYLFINKRRDRLKILPFEEGGYWLYYRLLVPFPMREIRTADKA